MSGDLPGGELKMFAVGNVLTVLAWLLLYGNFVIVCSAALAEFSLSSKGNAGLKEEGSIRTAQFTERVRPSISHKNV